MATAAHCHPHCKRRLSPSWSDIPDELLTIIFGRISDLSDLQACLAVCPTWRSTAARTVRTTPSLLLFEKSEEQEGRKLLAFDKNNPPREFCLYSPIQFNNWTIHHSYRGWLLGIHEESEVCKSALYNPITKVVVHLPTPPSPPPPGGAMLRFVTSTTPTDPNCLIFLTFPQVKRYVDDDHTMYDVVLAFCRPGDKNWVVTNYCEEYHHDEIFYKGELYLVDIYRRLFVFNQEQQEVKMVMETKNTENARVLYYLVEELGTKKLLMIERRMSYRIYDDDEDDCGYAVDKTESFRFFKLKRRLKGDKGAKWKKVRRFRIDNHALFLERGDTMFVSTLENPNYKPNCIYFIDGFYKEDPLDVFMVYDLENSTLQEADDINLSYSQSMELKNDNCCRWFSTSRI